MCERAAMPMEAMLGAPAAAVAPTRSGTLRAMAVHGI